MKERVIVDFGTASDAKKVEETVKTGYAEEAAETFINWMAVEEDLESSYDRLAATSSDPQAKEAYAKLREGSKSTIAELSRLLKALEELDRDRVRRIELLEGLMA